MSGLGITLEFGGGAELLVGKVKRHEVNLPVPDGSLTVGHLLVWVRDNLVKERPELLLKDPSAGPETIDVRPGILVLINDADWELLGQTSCGLAEGDNVTLISTLHGG